MLKILKSYYFSDGLHLTIVSMFSEELRLQRNLDSYHLLSTGGSQHRTQSQQSQNFNDRRDFTITKVNICHIFYNYGNNIVKGCSKEMLSNPEFCICTKSLFLGIKVKQQK